MGALFFVDIVIVLFSSTFTLIAYEIMKLYMTNVLRGGMVIKQSKHCQKNINIDTSIVYITNTLS